MQAIMETLFDAVYLVSVITIGILMIRGSKGNRQFRLFGFMAVVLGAGDAFHLIPRAVALCTTGLENYTVPLGLGKWITSAKYPCSAQPKQRYEKRGGEPLSEIPLRKGVYPEAAPGNR